MGEIEASDPADGTCRPPKGRPANWQRRGWLAASHVAAMLRIGADVAAHRKARPPADYLAQAGAELAAAGVLADPLFFIAQVRAHLHEEDHGEGGADV